MSSSVRFKMAKYPKILLGFLSQNFSKSMETNLNNIKKLITLACDEGFAWIEIRDHFASLSPDECSEISTFAEKKRIEICYSISSGLLDDNFWDVYSRAISNATYFNGPRTIRAGASGEEFTNNKKKSTWNLSEIYRLVENAKFAGNFAKMNRLTFVTENGYEAIKGDGIKNFGSTEFFANVISNVGLEFDTGNPFCASRKIASVEDVKSFLEKYLHKLCYVHLKSSTEDNKQQSILGENPLHFDYIFSLLERNNILYVGLELVPKISFNECIKNHQLSKKYLSDEFG